MRVFSQGGHTKHRREWNTRTVPGLPNPKVFHLWNIVLFFLVFREWPSGAMVLGKFPVPGSPTL